MMQCPGPDHGWTNRKLLVVPVRNKLIVFDHVCTLVKPTLEHVMTCYDRQNRGWILQAASPKFVWGRGRVIR